MPKKNLVNIKSTYHPEILPKVAKTKINEKLSISKKSFKNESKLSQGVKKTQRLKERKKKFLDSILKKII
jgi:hypothetical protein